MMYGCLNASCWHWQSEGDVRDTVCYERLSVYRREVLDEWNEPGRVDMNGVIHVYQYLAFYYSSPSSLLPHSSSIYLSFFYVEGKSVMNKIKTGEKHTHKDAGTSTESETIFKILEDNGGIVKTFLAFLSYSLFIFMTLPVWSVLKTY